MSDAITRPGIKEHDKQLHECDQYELVEKKMRHHGNAPSQRCEMGAFYRVWTPLGLSTRSRYATARSHPWTEAYHPLLQRVTYVIPCEEDVRVRAYAQNGTSLILSRLCEHAKEG